MPSARRRALLIGQPIRRRREPLTLPLPRLGRTGRDQHPTRLGQPLHLDERGHAQARHLAEYLAGEHVDALFRESVGPVWDGADEASWAAVHRLDPAAVWEAKRKGRAELVAYARARLGDNVLDGGAGADSSNCLDP